LEPKDEAITNPELVTGQWLMRCEARTLDDIRALGGNNLDDDRGFAAAARLSEINLALYRALAQPLVRAWSAPATAEAMQRLRPLRLQYEAFGPGNPWMAWVAEAANSVRDARQPASSDNFFVKLQEQASQQIVQGLEAWRNAAERLSEQTFYAVYGARTLQAALGINTTSTSSPRKAAKSLPHAALVESHIADLRGRMTHGGVTEALARSLIYVRAASGTADERGLAAIRRIRQLDPGARQRTLADFKALIREQFFLLLIDEDAALETIVGLLPEDIEERAAAFEKLLEVLEARGQLIDAEAERLERVRSLFGIDAAATRPGRSAVVSLKAY